MKCEYSGCDKEATLIRYAKKLCIVHETEFDRCMKKGPGAMLKFWIDMHGGPEEVRRVLAGKEETDERS